eukprot:7818181-Ditylum_brightwellii.AAC.1
MAKESSKISSVNKKRKGKGFTSIDIPASWPSDIIGFEHVDAIENPKKTKKWRKINVPQEIEFYLLMQNKLHFGQVQGTLFTIPPLSVEVDWGTNLVTSKLILEGNYTNEELLDIENLLIHHCRRKYDCKLVDAKITEKEWQEKIAVWDEWTTTLPSGHHLGHFKALLS